MVFFEILILTLNPEGELTLNPEGGLTLNAEGELRPKFNWASVIIIKTLFLYLSFRFRIVTCGFMLQKQKNWQNSTFAQIPQIKTCYLYFSPIFHSGGFDNSIQPSDHYLETPPFDFKKCFYKMLPKELIL